MAKDTEEFFLIFEDGDPLRAEVVRAALEAAEIDCFIKNEGVQNLFAMGSMGGLNPLMGTVKVYIRPEDRTRAEVLLKDLQAPPEPGSGPEPQSELPPESFPEPSTAQGKGFLSWLRRLFIQ
ncbi:MAG TPA: DUF2007 domain-containing protein [Candidatus Omnitrophota bacterium]|nr:DUF2007 domain-containing protein [Candidatus Omnitrophota bacterium]